MRNGRGERRGKGEQSTHEHCLNHLRTNVDSKVEGLKDNDLQKKIA